MRKLFGFLAVGALLLGGGTASAAPVFTTATMGLTIQGIGTISISGAGTVSVSGSTVKVGANLAQQVGSLVIPVTGTTAIQSITAVNIRNAGATFSLGGVTGQAPSEICGSSILSSACDVGGGIGGAMGILGTVNIRVNAFVNIPVHLSTAKAGQGGAFVTPVGSISGDAGVWTTQTGKVGLTTSTPTTKGASSPFTLVTPTFVNAFSGLAKLPLFGSFRLDNVTVGVPEPGTLLLLASGVVGLGLVGRRRR